MLRTVFTERLAFRYHMADLVVPAYALIRAGKDVKLTRSSTPDPNPGLHSRTTFRRSSAPLTAFAEFLSPLLGRDVVDATSLPGRYRFDVDWTDEFMRGEDPVSIALSGVKELGLRIEERKLAVRVLVVDRINQEPTPN